jgi:hypothetical protein
MRSESLSWPGLLDGGHVALAHSPAILGMEESGKATAR